MKRLNWQVELGLYLILLSVLVYCIHYIIFRDLHHILIYFIGDLGFVFIQILIVTLIIHRILNERERKKKLEKLNMVIGVFFSEVGTELLTYFSDLDPKLDDIRKYLMVDEEWTEERFSSVSKRLRKYDYSVDIKKVVLEDLRTFLVSRRNFMVRLLENPTLLEHESFTRLLRSTFHLTEELSARKKLSRLPETDYEELTKDIKRTYILLVSEWLDYMKYLRYNYPYLFSLGMRINPFSENASPIVRE